MPLEDREEYVDMVAQAVIDRIEERDRLAALVDMVVRRVLELQKAQFEAEQESKPETEPDKETTTDAERIPSPA